jgi:cation diffusion facilitator family transporter
MSTSPARYALYSIAASIATLGLKFGAWGLTGSVGLLSDALESFVNLAAGLMALYSVLLAAKPADTRHAYGHGKIEFFAGLGEGLLILTAAGGIVWAAVARFLHPAEVERLGLGLVVALVAAAVNWQTSRVMLKASARFDSMTLEADARHLMTDVWTSVGLVAGLAVLVAVPEWHFLDPLIALLMAANILRTALELITKAINGLMDHALPEDELGLIDQAIRAAAGEHAHYHGLRTRKSGAGRFVEFHLLVPGRTTVRQSHDLCEAVEAAIHARLPRSYITCHVEPEEDPASWDGEEACAVCGHDVHSSPGEKE